METSIIDNISKKNLGQLLGVLDALNCSDAMKGVVKSYFWKNSDEIKNEINNQETLEMLGE